MSDAHGQHQGSGERGRRSYRIAGSGDRRTSSPGPFGHVDDLIPGYALGALDAAEAAAVDAHVRVCSACDRALADAQRTVGMIPFTLPRSRPSFDAKVALFSRVAHVQKAAAAAALPTANLDAFRTPTLPKLSAQIPAPLGATTFGPAGPVQRGARSGWIATAVSLPLLIALIATGFWGLQMRHQLATQDAHLTELQAEFANFASGTTSYPLSPGFDAPQAEGQIVLGANQRDGFLQIDVNTADGPRAFEFLVNQDGKLIPAGEVTVNEQGQGQTRFELDQPLSEYESVHIRAKPVDASGAYSTEDTLVRSSEGPLGSTGSGLDVGP